MKKIIMLLILSTVIIGVITSCSNTTNKIKNVGVILPLSGEMVVYGNPMKNAMIQAVKIINNDDDPDNDINLIFEDSKCEPNQAVNSAQKLILQNVKAIIGDACSSSTAAILPIINEKKIVLLSPTASSPSLSKQSKWFFRLYPSDTYQGKVAADYLNNYKTASIIAINDDYGRGLAETFEKKFKGTIESINFVNNNEKDFKTILLKSDSDIIYVVLRNKNWKELINNYIELGLDNKLFGSETVNEKEIKNYAKSKGLNIKYTWLKEIKIEARKEFEKNYEIKYNIKPAIFTYESYDSVMLISKIINKNPMNKALRKIKIQGISGNIAFDDWGDLINREYEIKSTI